MDETDEIEPAPQPKLSKTPSWIMLGFLLGALFMWALPTSGPGPTAAVAPVSVSRDKPTPRPLAQPRVTAVEAIFSEWGKFAVWENDLTEVALWNPDVNRYADVFEVARLGSNLYFRSIPHFTKPLLTHGVPDESPMQFLETEEHRQRFLKDVSDQNKRNFSDNVRETFAGKGRTDLPTVPVPNVEPQPTPTPQP